MTGLDLSAAALRLAEPLAAAKGVACRWQQADLTKPLADIHLAASFDFAYDWEVLHHVLPEDRPAFVANVHRMVRPGGRYFSVCFSEADTSFEGQGRYRRSRIGTDLYFSSESEMRALFEPLFVIERLDSIQVPSKSGNQHIVIRALMHRR
jgi:SAM-dependent methyltransferase